MSAAARVFANGVVRFRYAVIATWLIAAVAGTLLLPDFEEAQTDSLGDLVATDAEALDTEIRSHELFGFPLLSRTVVVQRDRDGLDAAALARSARNITQLNLGELPGLEHIRFALGMSNVLGEPPFSREESTTALTYLFFPIEIGPVGRTGLAHRYASRHLDRPEDAFVGVTGAAPARAEQSRVIADSLPLVELATIALVVLATAAHFRAVGAPLLNLAAIAVAYLLAARAIAAVGDALGLVVPAEIEPVIVALLFGIVTDYSIFFLARFRGALAEGEDERQAARRTTAELLPIIFVAGLTVAAASATLALARLGFFQSFGPGLALSVLIALAVATTFVPAGLAIFGRRLFWPSRPRPEANRHPPRGSRMRDQFGALRHRLLTLPTRRPVLVVVITTVPLLGFAVGLFGLDVGNRTITSLPDGAEAKLAYRQASQGFAPGILSPTVVIVEADGITRQRGDLRRLQSLIERRAGIAAVVGPGEARLPAELGAVYSTSGDAARYFVVLNADPFGSRAIETVNELAADLPGLLKLSGLDAQASLAGDTALSAETVTKSRQDIARVVPAATLVVFAILAAFLLALVAPVYLVLTSLLALAASLGLTVFVFEGLLGRGDITFYVPLPRPCCSSRSAPTTTSTSSGGSGTRRVGARFARRWRSLATAPPERSPSLGSSWPQASRWSHSCRCAPFRNSRLRFPPVF